MKLSTPAKTFTIAAITALALGIAPVAKADAACSNATLNGTFAYKGTGAILTPPAFAGPIAQVSTLIFDGHGGITGAGALQQNGTNNPLTETGTYTVNPDCTGTLTVNYSLGFTSQFFFVIDSIDVVGLANVRGDELQILCEDMGVVLDGVARRLFTAPGSTH